MITKTLPELDHFVPVAPTKEPVTYADLRTLDLSQYDKGPEAKATLAEELRLAMTTQGFFILINHGISEEEVTRQVDIGHHIITNTPEEEKKRLKAPIVEEGSYFGFKPLGHWTAGPGIRDRVENFNVSRHMTLDKQPETMKPFIPEVQEFIDHAHKQILFKLLRLFAIALKLEDEDYFVKLHDYNRHDETFLRYMEYFDTYTEAEKEHTRGLWLGGHQDLTSVSLLWSQPMTSLQVRDFEGNHEWKYVPYVPGAMIINCGEVMMWWTGDYFKSAIHRVHQPPADQRGRNRCGVFYFCLPNDDVVINTLLDESVVLRNAGVKRAHAPDDAPTSKEWANARIKITGLKAKFTKEEDTGDMAVEKVGKVITRWYR